jgi:hypothetical protein
LVEKYQKDNIVTEAGQPVEEGHLDTEPAGQRYEQSISRPKASYAKKSSTTVDNVL